MAGVVFAALAVPHTHADAAFKELYGITENQSAKYKKLNISKHYHIRKDGADHFITFKARRSDIYEVNIVSDGRVDIMFKGNNYSCERKKTYTVLLDAKEVLDIHIKPLDKDAEVVFSINEVEAVG